MSERHNRRYDGRDTVAMLNENVAQWLQGPRPFTNRLDEGVASHYERCLVIPEYTIFSNSTSADQYNQTEDEDVVCLETAHNALHLGIGGFDNPSIGREAGLVSGANGDMGEANTSGLDPIFYFHHAFVDRMFWLWQLQHGRTEHIDILSGYAGTNASDSQGPTPGLSPGDSLTMQTPLHPFTRADGTCYTSVDMVNIESLGYTYGPGSLQGPQVIFARPLKETKLMVSGINRSLFEGSFVIHAFAELPAPHDGRHHTSKDTEIYLGKHPVFSRFNIQNCGNCLAHVEASAAFPLSGLSKEQFDTASYRVVIQHRGPYFPEGLKFRCTVDGKPARMADNTAPLDLTLPEMFSSRAS